MTSLNSRRTGSFGNLNSEGTWNSFGTVMTSHGFENTTNTVNTSMGVIHVSTDVEVSSDQQFQPKKQVE